MRTIIQKFDSSLPSRVWFRFKKSAQREKGIIWAAGIRTWVQYKMRAGKPKQECWRFESILYTCWYRKLHGFESNNRITKGVARALVRSLNGPFGLRRVRIGNADALVCVCALTRIVGKTFVSNCEDERATAGTVSLIYNKLFLFQFLCG